MKTLERPFTTIVHTNEDGEREVEITGPQLYDLSSIGELEGIPQPDQEDHVARIQEGAGDIHER